MRGCFRAEGAGRGGRGRGDEEAAHLLGDFDLLRPRTHLDAVALDALDLRVEHLVHVRQEHERLVLEGEHGVGEQRENLRRRPRSLDEHVAQHQ